MTSAPGPHDPPEPGEQPAPGERPEPGSARDDRRERFHRRVSLTLQALMLAGLVASVAQRNWMPSFLILWILVLSALPLLLKRRLRVYVPPEFELVTIGFLFASLFLGSVHGYYERYWWWDVMLHTGSGFLLGVLGFLLVYVLNEDPDIRLHMRPAFVALFAFTFAVGLGALWEIFEFAMDQLFGWNMQKSGLVDTMWDLIVDTVGAAVVSGIGFVYMRSGTRSFVEDWSLRFVERNPQLFVRRRE